MPDQSTANYYSTGVGLIYIFNLIVGTGALTLPLVFSRAGWLLGTITILILGFISFITATFIIESMASANGIFTWETCQSRKKALRTFGETEVSSSDSEDTPLVLQTSSLLTSSPNRLNNTYRYYILDKKVELGEMATMFFGKGGVITFYICLAVYLYGDLSIYAAAIGKSVTDVICTYQPINLTCNETIPDTEICWQSLDYTRFHAYRIFLTIFMVIVCPFVFFDIQKTKYLQLLTSMMRWVAFAVMILYSLKILIDNGAQGSPPVVNFLGLPELFGACVYSFMCHHSLPGLIAPIANKSMLNKSLFFDYILIGLFYILLAITGTFSFARLDDLYTLDFGPRGTGNCSSNNNILSLIIEYYLALFPVFTLSTSFPIIAITLRNNLQSIFLNNTTTLLSKLIFPFLVILPPYLIAMKTENLKLLVNITGSFAGAAIQYIIPTILVYYARKKAQNTIGLGVKNKFSSPFSHSFWLIFVILWAFFCITLVSINLLKTYT